MENDNFILLFFLPFRSDLSSVKYEILSMTEKYSVKCLENATLQEKLEVMSQQLKSTTSQVTLNYFINFLSMKIFDENLN